MKFIKDSNGNLLVANNKALKITAAIDSNIVPGNIKKDVDILGVIGTLEGPQEYEYVDLGLPSGLKWATCNLGAVNPQDDGLYFSWGNTFGVPKEAHFSFDNNVYAQTPGHQISSSIPLSQDAANVMWGGNWRMPSIGEFQELCNYTDTATVADYEGSGISGMKFMKKSDNSVFIFIPYSGDYYGLATNIGKIWSKSQRNTSNGYLLYFSSGTQPDYDEHKYMAFPIRPVLPNS